MKLIIRKMVLCAFLAVAASTVLVAQSKEFIVSLYVPDVELNPLRSYSAAEAQLYTALFEGLLSYNPQTLVPEPAVAERWEISEDGLEYRFFLREDAAYWNGDRVTAEHFRDTWLSTLAPYSETPYSFLFDAIEGAFEYRTGEIDDVNLVGIRVEDTELVVTLRAPAPHLLSILAHHSFVPLHPRMRRLSARNWERLNTIITNGPYFIKSNTDEQMLLTRNDLYWDRENVEIPTIIIQYEEDAELATRKFNTGEIDWVVNAISFDGLFDNSTLILNAMFATTFFFFVADDETIGNEQVRQALALLLPWDEIRDIQFYLSPTSTLVPQVLGYPARDGIEERDVERALLLLEEAGYPEGRGLPPIVVKVPESEERISAIMKEVWESYLDTEVVIEKVENALYFESLGEDDYSLGLLSWIGDFADPLTFLQLWTADSNLNEARYADPLYDDLVWRSSLMEGEERVALLVEAENRLLEGAVILPVHHSTAVNLIDLSIVLGWYANPLDIHPFKHIKFRSRKPIPGIIQGPNPLSEPKRVGAVSNIGTDRIRTGE